METEHENKNEELPKITPKTDFETPAAITWLRRQYAKFQGFTTKSVSDNLWVIGLKLFLKGIMVLILIIMSPFILFVIIFSLMIAG